MKDT
jgi:hypothetical protein